MRIVFIHPDDHSCGAEIAGNWAPAWVVYLSGHLKAAGFDDITFVDAKTNNLTNEQLRVLLGELKPDIGGATAITPSV